ncbi:hypothetical protein L861_02970 [Litchfieldella anticariensis FP35 = DSM 16096]|uniref:Uncharacterized protein n=1 Tax=Litchfieldella anticariensis (strain DSM 16096 / CECT 5854 / CIP 108499 / LMG 22089 / FP35) TaxID=1121939 RepID=S2KQF9_LITA3|nr:hypothetical protein [Halomonas anticariensis]EPC04297.1 hypothetical protein L861_02970 [Halomonas anticariensis FP35 = DSM 16096]
MDWFSANASAINAIASVLTLFVWLFYAQLLYAGYKRQRRPRILINRGRGKDIHSLCIISNMSAESIYVQGIVAVLETSDGELKLDISEYQQSEDEDRQRYQTHQGPLESGDYLHVDTFHDIVRRVAGAHHIDLDGYRPRGDVSFQSLEIRLLSIYGPEDRPIGARRRFLFEDDGQACSIRPTTLDTQRLNSAQERRMIQRWMRELET